MNEYQQALVRIIELEDRNAELLEALKLIRTVSGMPYPIRKSWLKHYAGKSIRKAGENSHAYA